MISKCMYATQKRWKNVRRLLKGLENTYVYNLVLTNTKWYTPKVVLFLTLYVQRIIAST